MIFDIEEFAVFDGPGIRSAVFFMGCPLRCEWCHNPEGLSMVRKRAFTRSLCVHCGACSAVCLSPDRCTACGDCVKVCPKGCLRIVGEEVEAAEVARRVARHEKLLKMNGGGVTFSGGEPMMQPDFLLEIRGLLSGLHACVETSGCVKTEDFGRVARQMDLVIMDIKLVDSAAHERYTGMGNEQILFNLARLKELGVPTRIRVPLIPTVNDTWENMEATARLLEGFSALEKVELMRYNKAAGAKYAGVDLDYRPSFPTDRAPNVITAPFLDRNMEVEAL